MKAAVIYQRGGLPTFTDFAEPQVSNDSELLVTVKAVALKHLDKSRASGNHYSTKDSKGEGQVPGGDGICLLPDDTRVYAIGVSGMLAEKAIIDKRRIVLLPAGISDAVAAALPNAVIGAAMGLKFKAGIQPGDVVLVNGATGFTGNIAVQIARHYGAKKIIVTGRNQQSLNELLLLGADEAITLLQDDDSFNAQLSHIHMQTPIDIVIDYLWGHTAEMILAVLKGDGGFTNRVRYVSVGSVTGDTIQLSAANLRSVDLQLTGSGMGAWSKQQVGLLFSDILPEMFQLAAKGKLIINTVTVNLEDVGDLWNVDVPGGKRLVVTI